MNETTARRRGRHAAPRPPRPSAQATAVVEPIPSARVRRRVGNLRLPGMEVLGFYDEPYRVVASSRRRFVPPPRSMLGAPTATSRVHSSSTAMVADLWETTELDSEALEWWKPGVIARSKLGGREIRTATIVASMLLAAVVGALLWFVVKRPVQIDSQARADFAAATQEVLGTTGPLADLAKSLGDAESPDLVSSTATILAAESAARDMFSTAGALPPSAAGMSVHESAVGVSGAILDATAGLSKLVAFRLTAERILLPPLVPTDPSATDLTDATEQVAAWRADVDSGINELPPGVLTDFYGRMESWQQGLQAWQESYLDAIRQDDGAKARSIEGDQSTKVEGLLGDMRSELADRGSEMANSIENAATEAAGWSVSG